MPPQSEAAVVGSGPNGLAAAVTLARAGVPVTVFEAADTIGGGTRTAETVEPGVLHDVCSAIHPMALASEFFRRFEIERRVEFSVPEVSYAHPLDQPGQRAVLAYRDLDRTADDLGRDGGAYRRLYRPILGRIDEVTHFALGGAMLRWPRDVPSAILTTLRTVEQGTAAWNLRFRDDAAPALLTGVAAHSVTPMPSFAGAGVGLTLGALGHATGWPVPIGGSRVIADALAADLLAHGGKIVTGHRVTDIRELGRYRVTLWDTSARELARIAAPVLPRAYRRRLARFRVGNAAAKVDFVLDGPIPWRDQGVADTPTVHIGGSRAEIAEAEATIARGHHAERPFVLLAQPTRSDPTRNAPGVHAVWSYAHVPSGSHLDVSGAVIRQIERFAPGFRDRIVGLKVTTAQQLARYNSNYDGGDISAGAVSLLQVLARPTLSAEPWRTPAKGVYLCSASAAPGPGVHGLAGWHAARSALRHEFGLASPELGLG